MTVIDLAIAEATARKSGAPTLADKLQKERWAVAMGAVVNTESTGRRPAKARRS